VARREIAGDGGIKLTIFGGPGAKEYAAWQYGKYGRELMVTLRQPVTPHIGTAAVRPDAHAGPTPPHR
jgi:hypothetical protein